MNTLADRLPSRRDGTVIRALRVSDLGRFHAYRADETLARFQAWGPMTADEALAFLQATSTVTDLIPGDWIQLGVAEASTDQLIGDLGLFLAHDGRWAEVGFTLRRESQGQGHATRAVVAAIELVLASSAAAEIRAVTDVRNDASIRVLDRAGFQFALQQQAVCKGEACTELVYVYRPELLWR
jgi:[ribosomal protein S5]-alanine N-acetyltransferase